MSRLHALQPSRFVTIVVAIACALPAHDVTAQHSRGGAAAATRAQTSNGKKPLSLNDYTRWRAIEAQQLSSDGNWLTYVQRLTNVVPTASKPELHLKRLDTGADTAIADATQASFSSDSRWIAYLIEPPPPARQPRDSAGGPGATPPPPSDTTQAGRGARTPPAPRRAELRELASGKVQTWQDIQSATFSPTATHLLLRRRPAANAGGTPAAAATPGGPPGAPPGGPGGGAGAAANIRPADALLHNLATGLTTYLGNVGEAAFNRTGDLLAYTIEAPVKDGNGLFVIDLATGRTWVLDNDARTYSRLAWNDSGTGVAVLKGKEVPRMRERENVVLAVPNVRSAMVDGARPVALSLDSTVAGFPRGWVISDRATLSWSDDNRRVFLGLIGQSPAPDTGRRRNTDSLPDVDVWRTEDERVQSLQMIRAEADRNYTFRQAFDLPAAKFVPLADSTMRELEVAPDGSWAVGRDTRGYIKDYGRDQADVYRVDVATGQRTLMFKALVVDAFAYGFSADSKHWLYWQDERFHQYDAALGASRPLIAAGAPSFVNREFDYPGPKPSYGLAGYAADGSGVIVNHRYDLWYLPYAAGQPRNLTNGEGTRQEIVFRVVRKSAPDPMALRAARDGRVIDLTQPVTLAAYGEWTKKAGFHELAAGALRPIVYEDATFSTPVKAAKADTYLFTRQTFVEFPDLRVAGPDWATSKKVSDANPQQAEFNWGRRVLFDFRLKDGKRSQGILALPDDYQPGEKRPMIVTFYEKNSQNLHRYAAPSFITGMGNMPMEAVSKGYITMMPDVYFRTGQSHSDMLEAVEAATKKVIELGYADPKRIGVHGHSYGGEGAAFIGTRSRMFAAVGVGAGVSDLTTDFSQSWGWTYAVTGGSGDNAFEYYLNGQGRWGFSPWDKPEVYRYESALTHVPQVTAPFLIMHGTDDPTVSFVEGMNLYSALRYNKKPAIMLAYPKEGHGLRGLANRRDLTERYFQFFDHYLRGAPAPAWMTQGVPFLVKETTRVVP
jgi:dipeptidyl aminopeptidase/acylaminoacyl peptidase